jgi:hypothetical protein
VPAILSRKPLEPSRVIEKSSFVLGSNWKSSLHVPSPKRSLVPRKEKRVVKQLSFDFVIEECSEPVVPLDTKTEEEVVAFMAAAVAAVHDRGGLRTDEE